MSTSPLIWFLLLDSATGQPYKGTTVSSVVRSSLVVPIIDQFRDAVYLENSSILTGIASSQLLVYKNKSSFDKRNAQDANKEEPLEEDSLIDGLGKTEEEEDILIVVVPSSRISSRSTSESNLTRKEPTDKSLQDARKNGDAALPVNITALYDLNLNLLQQEIRAIENSDEYKILATKNIAWAVPAPTEQEKMQWKRLKERIDELERKRQDFVDIILSKNAYLLKKLDKIRKRYKDETAIQDERLLLSDVAIKMWERFGFKCEKPTFGALKKASGFKEGQDVRDYFRMKENGQVKEDEIKDFLTEMEWIFLINLHLRVNVSVPDTLIANQDGSLRLVLENDVYDDVFVIAQNLVHKLYGSEKKVDIKDATSDW